MATSLQAGKLIIGAIAVSVDPTGTAATTLGIDSVLQIKDWLKKTPDLAKLSTELDKAFTTEIAKPRYDKPEGIRTLLPQMLEASQPNGADIAQNSLDAALIFDTMQAKLSDTEHLRPENQKAFRDAILPLLEKACDDPRLEAALRPALTRADGAVQREQSADIKAVLAAVQAGQTGIPLKDLQDLAREFGEEITDDSPRIMEFLRSRATDFFALKSEVDAIPDTMKQLANLKSAAQDAIDRVDLEEVEHLMAMVHETELNEAAKSSEIRANNALLRGKAEDAYRYLSAAADSFAAINSLEPARKRILQYSMVMGNHGLRFGGKGLSYAEQLVNPVLNDNLRAIDPWLWGAGQNCVAIALKNQGTRTQGAEGADFLAQAVIAYRDALEVYTHADHPVQWAMTQNNIATTLQEQGNRTQGPEGANLLAQAVSAYRAALKVRTRADHPVDWAMTQNNLAIALQNQGTRTEGAVGADLLTQAVIAYCNALEVRTRADHPVHWAETKENIAICEEARAAHDTCTNPRPPLNAALQAVENALTIFDPDHMSYNHTKATKLRDDIQAKLDALPPP